MKINGKIQRRLGSALFGVLAALAATGCNDDLGLGTDRIELGEKAYGKLSVPFGPSGSEVLTRAVDFSDDALVKIDSYWIGVYDTYTGELLGTCDTVPRKSDGSRYTMRNDVPFVPDEMEIWYYTQHPEAYIVGVINYVNVTAKKAGESETAPLITLLREAETFEDFCRISVNTASATSANRSLGSDESCPLMMGFYTVQTGGVKSTVNADGSMSQDNVKTRFSDSANSSVDIGNGAIRLQRLMAEINVQVTGSENVKIKSLEYRVVNNPAEVYLTEHTTDNIGSIRRELDEYKANTANSADLVDNGYTSYSGFSRASLTDENSYAFTYQEYENKHWGRTWNWNDDQPFYRTERDHSVREAKYENTGDPETDVFKTLCISAENPYNNKASYMIIKADIEAVDEYGNLYSGPVQYTIHEGCASNVNGTAAANGFDYQRNRNTRYTYRIAINGIDEILSQVYVSVWGEKGIINDGLAGELWTTHIISAEENEPYFSMRFPLEDYKNIKFLFWEKTPEGETLWGDSEAMTLAPTGLPYGSTVNPIKDCPFLDEVSLFVSGEWNGTAADFRNQTFTGRDDGMLYLNVSMGDYQVMTGNMEELDIYRRGFYIVIETRMGAENGVSATGATMGIEQKPEDGRMEFPNTSIGYVPDHNYGYNSSYTTAFWGVKGAVTYICWSPIGPAQYYLLQIDDRETIRVDAVPPAPGSSSYEAIHCRYEIPADMKSGYHTITVTPVGDPNIYKPSFPRTLSTPLEVFDSWDFGTQPFFLDQMGSSTSYSTISYAGLSVVGGSKGMTASSNRDNPYIQTDGSGSTSTRCFRFTVARPGTVRVRACSSANSTDSRTLYLYQSGYGTTSVGVTTPNTERDVTYSMHTPGDITDLTELTLYTGASLRIYEIEFIPD